VFGQTVTFTATVTSPTATPTGTVVFVIDGTGQQPVSLDASGKATFATSTLSAGDHTVTANYQGNGNIAGSSPSTPITQRVTQTTSSMTLAASQTSSVY